MLRLWSCTDVYLCNTVNGCYYLISTGDVHEQRPGATQWQTIHLLPDTLGTDAWPEYSGPAPRAVPVAAHNRHSTATQQAGPG